MKLILRLSGIFLFVLLSQFASGFTTDSLAFPRVWLKKQNTAGQKLLDNNQEFDKAVSVFKNAYNFASTQKLLDHFPEISIGYGIALYKNGDIQNAHTILLDVLPKIGESELRKKAEVSQLLGMSLVFKNKYPEAYKFQMDALKYFSDLGDSTGLMSVYYDLGSNFSTQEQTQLALENYEKGIAIAKSIQDTKMTILGITAIGSTLAQMKEYEKALKYVSESMALAKEINDDEEIAWASINSGHILGQLKRYKASEKHLKRAYNLSFKIGNKMLTAYTLEQLSELYLKLSQLDKALSTLDESYLIFQELGSTNSLKEVTKKYAEIHFKKGNFDQYKKYIDSYILLKDSLYSEELMESMAQQKQDFEIHKMERENQIALLTKDQEIANAKNQITIALTGAGAVIFLLCLTLMWMRNKAAHEKNQILKAKNAEILRQNKSLAESNRDLEKFTQIISHDLKEPLRNISGFTKLLFRTIQPLVKDENISDYVRFITSSTDQMSELLNGLMIYSRIGVDHSQKEMTDLHYIALQVIGNLKILQEEKNCQVQLQPLPSMICRPNQMVQVFQNLVNNALKFVPEQGGEIKIGVKDLGHDFQFFVQDNGIGIDPEYQEEVFVVFKRLHHRGVSTGAGIGLATCKKIIENHGGQIWVESELDKGACFYFTLPKKSIAESSLQNTENYIPTFKIESTTEVSSEN